jgi:hypothetical protein
MTQEDAGTQDGRGAIEICHNCQRARFICGHSKLPTIIDGHCDLHTFREGIMNEELAQSLENDEASRINMSSCGNCQEFYLTCGKSRKKIPSDSYCEKFALARRLYTNFSITK